jgi:LuxR family maltose regulon positive regulatory protein
MKPAFMPRPRVDAHLREAVASARLTVLQAPLGAGKSAAAASAFAGDPHAVWLQAQPWHRGAFAAALVQAVREARPDFGRLTLGALEAGAGSAHLGRVFAQELTHIDEPLLLVVDNVQVFTGESGFVRFIEAAMSRAPAAARILALGRSLPEISLGLTAARGGVRILDANILAFDAAEIAAYARFMQSDIDEKRATEILRLTEGWAAGVALALAAPDIAAAKNSAPRMWAERYLTKHLLARLTPETVRFLEETSVFDTIDGGITGRIHDRGSVAAAIAELRRMGALVSEVEIGCFRIHPLLRELAQARLQARAGLSAAHADAAKAFAEAGSIGAAMFHAAASGDASAGAALLRSHADATVAGGDYDAVSALAGQIDPAGPDRDVRLYVDALLEKRRGSAEARETFARAAAAAQRSGDEAVYFKARSQVVEYDLGHKLYGDEGAIDELRRHAQSLDGHAQATVAVLAGWTRAIAHDFTGALSSIAGLDDALFSSGVLRAYAQTSLGDADAAEKTLDTLVRALENDDRVVMQTLTLIWFARLSLILGRITTASDAAAQAARLSKSLDLRAEEAALYVALAEIATHAGSVQDAVRYAELAKSRSEYAWYAMDVPRVRAFSEIALARAAFLGHDNSIARELSVRVAQDSTTPAVQRAVAAAECTIYTLLCDASASAAAIDSARNAVAAATPVDAADAVALAASDDVLAFLDAANGRQHESLLRGCDAFAGLLAYRRGLVTLEHAGIAAGKARRGEASAEAFETALAQITREGPRFEARLARAYAASFIKSKKHGDALKPALDLTARESEILKLLVEGLTNKEIAQRLVVSPRTIETHVERVLSKLEVGSRSRAIAKALRLGLVELPA